MEKRAADKRKKRYEKPKSKKEFFEPQMKKEEKFNEVICSCTVTYGSCSSSTAA